MNNVTLLRIMQQINTWGVIPGLIYLVYVWQWQYFVALVLGVLLISKFGASIGQHRYFTHRGFEMAQWKENIIAVLATLSTTGSILQFVTVHRYHHPNSDNGKDLHSPHEIGYWRSFWHWYTVDPTSITNPRTIKDLLRKPLVVWLHRYYFAVVFAYIALLAAIDLNLVVFAYIIPAGFAWWSSAVLSLPLHLESQGYRTFDTNDTTVNSIFWNWMTLGEGLHNNHHYRPRAYDTAWTKKPGEWDLAAWLVDLCLIKK